MGLLFFFVAYRLFVWLADKSIGQPLVCNPKGVPNMSRQPRSFRTVRDLSCDTCPWIPGRKGPAEPFHVSCFGDDPAVWDAIARWAASRFVWDCGPFPDATTARSRTDDAVQLFRYRLATVPAETWQRLGIGYGDRIRALWAVRAWCRKSGWQESKGGGIRKGSRSRAYVSSMSIRAHNPAAVAMAAEMAERGVTGKPYAMGRPRTETITLSRRDALAAIVGEPQREIVVGPIHVSGGVASITTDGKMREVTVKSVAYTVVGDDGTDYGEEENTTAWKMVPGYTRVEYPAGFVAEAVDAGTERNRYVPQPIPAPRPAGSVCHAEPVWAADVEGYRAALADYYASK